MKRYLCSLSLALLLAASLHAQPRFVINSSHAGPVQAMANLAGKNLLLTAGDDGMLRIYDTAGKTYISSIRVCDNPIQGIAINPVKNHVALFFEIEQVFSIAVWDWSIGKLVYTISLDKRPLYFTYSPLGNYLAACVGDWQSMRIYDAARGTHVSRITRSFGIVSFFTFSSKETTIMTYQPSGKISYWELDSGKLLEELSTQPEIIPVGVSQDRKTLLGYQNFRVVLLDLLSGKETAMTSLENVVLVSANPANDLFAFFTRSSTSPRLHLYSMAGSKLQSSWSAVVEKENPVTAITWENSSMITADSTGTITRISLSGNREVIAKNTIDRISDIAFAGDTLAVGTADSLVIVKSDFFTNVEKSGQTGNDLATYSRKNPFPGSDIGLAFLGGKGLFLWSRTQKNSSLALLDNDSYVRLTQCAFFANPVSEIALTQKSILSLETNGLTRILSIPDYKTSFQYTAQGINTMALVSDSMYLCGKSKLNDYDSALIQINAASGETLIIPDSSLIIHDIVYDAPAQTAYTLGFEQIGSSLYTVIKRRSGDNFSKELIMFKQEGDSVHSSMAFDAQTHKLYFTLGGNIIYIHSGTAITQLEKSGQPVRKILVHGDKIFSLNIDSSITVWSTVSGKIILDFFLFEDAGWVLLTRDGRFHSQGGGEKHVNVFEGSNILDRTGSMQEIEQKYRLNFRSR